jgi:hypothetical protein
LRWKTPWGENRGGTPTDVRTPLGARPGPAARHNPHCVCRRFASDFLSFFPFVPFSFVIAGLDPAIHVKLRLRMLPPAFACVTSAWTTGSSPVVTSKRQWRAIARALSRAARTRLLYLENDEIPPPRPHAAVSGLIRHNSFTIASDGARKQGGACEHGRDASSGLAKVSFQALFEVNQSPAKDF